VVGAWAGCATWGRTGASRGGWGERPGDDGTEHQPADRKRPTGLLSFLVVRGAGRGQTGIGRYRWRAACEGTKGATAILMWRYSTPASWMLGGISSPLNVTRTR